jgi:hypothetical protein
MINKTTINIDTKEKASKIRVNDIITDGKHKKAKVINISEEIYGPIFRLKALSDWNFNNITISSGDIFVYGPLGPAKSIDEYEGNYNI